jgi:hypothetical protein
MGTFLRHIDVHRQRDYKRLPKVHLSSFQLRFDNSKSNERVSRHKTILERSPTVTTVVVGGSSFTLHRTIVQFHNMPYLRIRIPRVIARWCI